MDYGGSITALGAVTVGDGPSNVYSYLSPTGSVQALRATKTSTDAVFTGGGAGDVNSAIYSDGSATFEGTVTANGTVLTRNVTLNLDADDPNAYETREEEYTEIETYKGPRGNELLTREVTKTREVTEYIGETMDVKSVLLKLTGALETLKTAAASATTCEELRTAIETALADV